MKRALTALALVLAATPTHADLLGRAMDDASAVSPYRGHAYHDVELRLAAPERLHALAPGAHVAVMGVERRDGFRIGLVIARADRDYDAIHERGVLVHEAIHLMQPEDMGFECAEVEAHAYHVQWLIRQGEPELARAVARNAERYIC